MASFKIDMVGGQLMKVGFIGRHGNDVVVRDIHTILTALTKKGDLAGGERLRITGPVSVPGAFAIAPFVCSRYGMIEVYSRSLGSFVVTSSCNLQYNPGDVLG